jgi:hypothetical protein
MSIRALSYGGGVQSTALLVLAARGEIDYPLAIFANVGDDSEHPDTLRYVREVAVPFGAAHGIEVYEAGGSSLLQSLYRRQRSVHIPVRMEGSGAPGRRGCTGDFKIARVRAELVARGATRQEPAVLAMGISLDEYHRMRSHSGDDRYRLSYPLVDRRLDRAACENAIRSAGLPVPPKSSCWFCPFKGREDWRRLKRETPDLFAGAVALERTLSARTQALGRGACYLSSALRPLDQAVGDHDQLDLFDGATCDVGGYCHA